jgi:glycerol-3-phosphate cytidylyltransferase-like family protein
LGDELLVVLARTEAVRALKGRVPRDPERMRAGNVRATGLARKIVLGDVKQGNYEIVRKHLPDVIAVGYDQEGLAADLRTHMRNKELPKIKIVRLKAYRPREYHSSLLD